MVAAAMIGGAVIGGVASNMEANKESSAARNAANAQTQAANQSIAEQQREYDQSRADQLPFLQAGYGALDKENALLNGDFSGFQNSPDYQFSLNQGIGALDKSAAARGSLYSGGHSQDLTSFAEGTANQFLNSYWNKLAGQAGQGQTTANSLGELGANTANNIGKYMTDAGDARASSYLQQGHIDAQRIAAFGHIGSNLLGYYTNRGSTSAANDPYSGYNLFNSGTYNVQPLNSSTEGTGAYNVFGLGGG